jgi:hypothetical protein
VDCPSATRLAAVDTLEQEAIARQRAVAQPTGGEKILAEIHLRSCKLTGSTTVFDSPKILSL